MCNSTSDCEAWVQKIVSSDKFIQRLLSNGNEIRDGTNGKPPSKIVCRECESTGIEGTARGFVTLNKNESHLDIVICTNRISSQKEIHEILKHEAIHAFDFANNKKTCDFSTCEGLAYSEIRAAREAECARSSTGTGSVVPVSLFPQLVREFLSKKCLERQERCVKAAAIRATSNLFPKDRAEECVNKVFAEAFVDLSPNEKET
jgi:hypothetical protein